jgi:IS5 family transposase
MQARAARLLSGEHFTVDGTLVDAWASHKSFQPKKGKKKGPPDDPGNPTVNFRGEKRSNETHASTTDPEAKLARKGDGQPARLSYGQHALMDNRHGLLVDLRIAEANGFAERQVALAMLEQETSSGRHRTVGADKAYDRRNFVEGCRSIGVTPHVAQNLKVAGGSAVDARTTRPPGYSVSQRVRKRVEEIFGWTKTVGGFRRTRYRSLVRTELASYFVGAAYNLLRISNLLAQPT